MEKATELKTKKMISANIGSKLTSEQMEDIIAGKKGGGAICSAVGFLYIAGMSMGAPLNTWIDLTAKACWYS